MYPVASGDVAYVFQAELDQKMTTQFGSQKALATVQLTQITFGCSMITGTE